MSNDLNSNYLPVFSKAEAVKTCEEYNATLPYCNYKEKRGQID